MRCVAVVLAGGTGTRVGLDVPKQLIKIAGKPIIEHTIAALDASPLVDEVLVMMAPGHLDPVRAIVRTGGYAKVTRILEGSGTRNDTTRAALDALGRRGVLRPPARRGPPAAQPGHHRGQRRGAAGVRRRRHRHPVAPTRSSRSTTGT